MRQDELVARLHRGLGDLPEDVGGPPPPGNGGYSPGYDTIGTRRTVPGAASATTNAGQSTSITLASMSQIPALAQFAPVIALLTSMLVDAVLEKRNFLNLTFTVDTTAVVQLRPKENRGYLLIQNNSAAAMFVGIGYPPTPVTGIQIPTGGNYEPLKVPQEDIYVLGSAAAQLGVVLYSPG